MKMKTVKMSIHFLICTVCAWNYVELSKVLKGIDGCSRQGFIFILSFF